MKIVIDISENYYNDLMILEVGENENLNYEMEIIRNGTPLPKCHGRLIDADSLIKAIEEKAKRLSNADTINGLCGAVALIFDEPTIIGADKEE